MIKNTWMIIATAIIISLGTIFYSINYNKNMKTSLSVNEGGSNTKIANPENTPKEPSNVKQNPVTLTGKLTKVDTGCFADGECYAEVDGKHVTLIMGWSRDTAGKIMGGDNSVGGLEAFIGQNVQVYANKLDEKNYTLYGDQNYYIAIK